MYDFDVVFIGSGHSCWHGALALIQGGKKVALVDNDLPGGTCTNYGCDAKILLDGPFEFVEGLERYNGLCVEQNSKIDWKKLMDYKHKVLLDIPGKEFLHGSRTFLDIEEMPEHLICIGAGIISMEFASMALTLGKKVTFIEFASRPLLAYPKKYVSKLVEKMTAQGAKFYCGEAVCGVEKIPDGYKVTTKSGLNVEGTYVLDATGRIANIEDIGLEELGIKASRRGIEVDDHLRTSVKNIFASGDVVDKKIPKLTPTAIFESNYIAAQILGKSDAPICYPVIPNLVFTLPRIGQVGVTIDEAEKNPDKYKIHSIPYGVQNEWVDNRELEIDITFIVDSEGHLAGATIYGSEAGTWLDFLTLVINKKITGEELDNMIFAFPTQTFMIASLLIPILRK